MAVDTLGITRRKDLQFADDYMGEDSRGVFTPREGLGWYARKQVEILETIARGFMFIGGEVGGGKDTFGVSTGALMKYVFDRPILLDFMPNRAFGEYKLYGISEIILAIKRIAKQLRVEGLEGSEDKKELAQFMEEATIRWLLEGEGYEIFKGAVWYISELKKLVYNRNPMSRTNKFMGSLGTVWRHLDLLVMGTHVYENELDEKAYLQYAKLRTNCTQTLTKGVFKVTIRRGAYSGSDFVVSNVIMPPIVFRLDGFETRDFLGGHRYFDLFSSKHMKFSGG